MKFLNWKIKFSRTRKTGRPQCEAPRLAAKPASTEKRPQVYCSYCGDKVIRKNSISKKAGRRRYCDNRHCITLYDRERRHIRTIEALKKKLKARPRRTISLQEIANTNQ
jgi:hypothetical protein